jgi:hypothetical protein
VIKFDMQRTVASQPSTRAGMNSPTDRGIQRGEPLRDGHANAMGLTARSATKLEASAGPVADGKFHAAARPGSGAMNVSALGSKQALRVRLRSRQTGTTAAAPTIP